MSRRLLLLLACAAAVLGAASAQAVASPGAYKILLAEVDPTGAKKLGAQLLSNPEVAGVDYVNTGNPEGSIPTAAQLAPYDLVVSIGDSNYVDVVSWGNSLADFVDQGGVVVQSAYDNWEDLKAFPQGRFSAGGYAPFIPGNNVNSVTTLGEFDAASPLMAGVTTLTSNGYNTAPALAPGASLVAKWNTGNNAIAYKGRVVSVTSYIGDDYGLDAWTGDYGRLVLNAARVLGRQQLNVSVSNPGGGTVASNPAGLTCGAVCSALFPASTIVTLTAKPKMGFAFAGFGGACVGRGCALNLAGGVTAVNASFVGFKPGKKAKLDKGQGKGTLSLTIGAPGKLVLSGKKVKKQTKSPRKAGKVKLPIVAKGKALATLRSTGKAKVKLRLAYTPTGGATTTTTKSVVLKLAG